MHVSYWEYLSEFAQISHVSYNGKLLAKAVSLTYPLSLFWYLCNPTVKHLFTVLTLQSSTTHISVNQVKGTTHPLIEMNHAIKIALLSCYQYAQLVLALHSLESC